MIESLKIKFSSGKEIELTKAEYDEFKEFVNKSKNETIYRGTGMERWGVDFPLYPTITCGTC